MKLEKCTCWIGLRCDSARRRGLALSRRRGIDADRARGRAGRARCGSAGGRRDDRRRHRHRLGRGDLDAHRPHRLALDLQRELLLAFAVEQVLRGLVGEDQQDRVPDRRHVGLDLVARHAALELERDADLRVAVGLLVGEVDDERIERKVERDALGSACRRRRRGSGVAASSSLAAAACAARCLRKTTAPAPSARTRASSAAPMTMSFFFGRRVTGASSTAGSAITADIEAPRGRALRRIAQLSGLEGNYRNRPGARSGDKRGFSRPDGAAPAPPPCQA